MDVRDLVNKEKLRCDDIISITLILSFGVLFLFFRLIVFMSIIVYPLSSLFLYGIYYFYKAWVKNKDRIGIRIVHFLIATFYVSFSSFMFWLIFSYPHVTISYVVYFLSIPIFYIGLAAILKGSIVNVYSPKYRKLNILIGILTILGTGLSVYYVEYVFPISLISLLLLLSLNGFLRSQLYLSEYGLSLRNARDLKIVFYLMDNLQLMNYEEEVQE